MAHVRNRCDSKLRFHDRAVKCRQCHVVEGIQSFRSEVKLKPKICKQRPNTKKPPRKQSNIHHEVVVNQEVWLCNLQFVHQDVHRFGHLIPLPEHVPDIPGVEHVDPRGRYDVHQGALIKLAAVLRGNCWIISYGAACFLLIIRCIHTKLPDAESKARRTCLSMHANPTAPGVGRKHCAYPALVAFFSCHVGPADTITTGLQEISLCAGNFPSDVNLPKCRFATKINGYPLVICIVRCPACVRISIDHARRWPCR
mmetsp:Transcript_102447/g.289729  ORF Transcript_102447/g.289729 Transcript_102447/m.289729 type:complete len:255 (+) Transcript_102447:824-1588(+)